MYMRRKSLIFIVNFAKAIVVLLMIFSASKQSHSIQVAAAGRPWHHEQYHVKIKKQMRFDLKTRDYSTKTASQGPPTPNQRGNSPCTGITCGHHD
ncbi:hypothetical protein PanWU01x14_155140 [Parasponia andersonii]|uniref:Transmembrane protein n=1 Tax=Parasponia andersonii TaxID=3476 RepID=A0A2P5CGM6_PARAD|nr:hypothetical protein PanWU01x14_155140 [Parasponia andersonii]